MFQKFGVEERKEKREVFRENPIYRILYTPLWKQRGDDLSPVEVWVEATNLACSFKEKSPVDSSQRVREAFDELCEKYSIFEMEDGEHVRRTFSEAEHSAMMVSLTAFLLLVNTYPEAKNHPYQSICKAINDVIGKIKGFEEIYEEARKNEDENESRGDFIEVADFIEEISSQKEPISRAQKAFACKAMKEFVKENENCNLSTMEDNERMLSRVNDNNAHCFQDELNLLRTHIDDKKKKQSGTIDYELLAHAIENCQSYFWANSAYAVVFCVCRDHHMISPNKSAFEEMIEKLPYNKEKKLSYTCPKGTISNAFSDNPIYGDNISTWNETNAAPRITKLRDALLKELKL